MKRSLLRDNHDSHELLYRDLILASAKDVCVIFSALNIILTSARWPVPAVGQCSASPAPVSSHRQSMYILTA